MENKEVLSDADLETTNIEIISIQTICRLCASQNERLISVFSEEGKSNDLENKINLYLPIKVAITDELPLQCCWNCATTLLAWHELFLTTAESDRKFRNNPFLQEKNITEEFSAESESEPKEDPSKDEISFQIKTEISIDDEENVDTPEEKFVCTICKTRPSRSRDLKRHLATCHPKNELSKVDNASFEAIANLSQKECTVCSLQFKNRLELKKHVKEVHNLTQRHIRKRRDEVQAQFFCDICEKGYTRKHDMEKHRNKFHSDIPPIEKKERSNAAILKKCLVADHPSPKPFYKCDFCERGFSDAYNFTRHRTIHTGVLRYCCHICGKSFRTSSGLNRHINEFHHGIKKYNCEICQKAFASKVNKDEHMNIHSNLRPYVCDICGKSFKQTATLRIHKMYHTNIFRFRCDFCDKKFRRRRELTVHSWLHTGKKPYACSKCKATFRLKNDLTRHLKTHDKVKECVCPECGSTFSQERYLKVHRRIHQRKSNDSTTISSVDDQPVNRNLINNEENRSVSVSYNGG